MRFLFYACCFLFIGLMSETVHAQKTADSPLIVGLDVGFVLSSQADSMGTTVNTQFIQIRSSYRFKRWFGISANAGYANLSAVGDIFQADSGLSRVGAPSTWVRKTHRIPVTIGPELNMRIGQGDLSVAARFGLVYHQSNVYLTNPSEEYFIRYNPTLNTYNSLSFNYTYWPQKRFGISIGIEIQDWLSGDYSATELTSASLRQYPELNLELINLTRPSIRSFELQLLQIGLTYRL